MLQGLLIMIRRVLIAVLLPLCLISSVRAGDQDLQQKIEQVRSQIEQEEAVRNRLREDLAGMDEKVENLKKQLKELEAKISENSNNP